MTMTSGLRKIALTTHITSTLGWLGGIVGFLALAIAGLRSNDPQLARGSYLAMELMGWYVLVPLCVASLATGLVMSLGTQWGLFRHYWVLIKFVITVVSAVILFMYTETLGQLGDLARNPAISADALKNSSPVLHSSLAILALLVNTVLSVYKPRGLTAYGRRKQAEPKAVAGRTAPSEIYGGSLGGGSGTVATHVPGWLYIVGIHFIGLALVFAVLHLISGGFPGH